MNDYLSHLVERSLNRTDVIKPRLASFFEPSVQGEPVFGAESGSLRLDVSSTPDETVRDNLQSAWRSDQTPQLKPAALQPAWPGSQQTPGQPRLGMTRQASPSSSSSSVSPEVTSQSSGKTPHQKSSQDLPAPAGGDGTYVVSPRAAAERSRSSAREPAIQPHGKTRPRASEPSTEEGDMHPARMMDQTPPLKPVTIRPAGFGSRQTPSQPRSGIIQQASSSASSASSVSPEVTSQSSGKTPQQKSSQDLPAPSGGDETYVVSPGAAAERNRASAYEPTIYPITIESSSPPTSPEVTAPQSAVRTVQQESDHEMLTPPSPGDGETYQPPRVTAERNRESTREPAIEQIVPSAKTQPRASEPAESAVIRVTIGRIEVRATTPPLPAAPRTLPPGPALTLDDYLKQRNGGQL